MNLPKMIYNELESHDVFGLKILKNGFDPKHIANLQLHKKDDH
jgi:hypothetical protein